MSQTTPRLPGGFEASDLTSAEVDHLESFLVPLAASVRALIDATIRTTADEHEVRRVTAQIDAATAVLRRHQTPGPAGVRFNAEGRSWQWGNAAAGVRNAAAPPLRIHDDGAGLLYADVDLVAAHEGPPGHLHGGMAALMLDQLMGQSAGFGRVPMLTGTLTLRYRRATPLARIRLESWIDRDEGHKRFVVGRIVDEAGVTVEADGVFIRPRWSRERANPS